MVVNELPPPKDLVFQAHVECVHVVTFDPTKPEPAWRILHEWLETHVGVRYKLWCNPSLGEYRFKHTEHATVFALTWM